MSDQLLPSEGEFNAIALDDAFLESLASGEVPPTTDDSVDSLLLAWRDELREAVPVAPVSVPLQRVGGTPQPSQSRWHRGRRGVAAAAALTAVFAASTGVAAALPDSPLHRALFGNSRPDATLEQVDQMLADVGEAIEDARDEGGITDDLRSVLGHRLDAAEQLLVQHNLTSTSLSQEIDVLRADLADLPRLAPPSDEPVPPGDRPAGDDADAGASDGSQDRSAGNTADDSDATTTSDRQGDADDDDSRADSDDGDGDGDGDGDADGAEDGSDSTGSDTSDEDGSSDSADGYDSSDSGDSESSYDGDGSDSALEGSGEDAVTDSDEASDVEG